MRIYLLHIYSGWCRSFGTIDEIRQYLREHGFTRQRLYAYAIIEGLGRWSELAAELPLAPPDPALGTHVENALQDPF